MIKDSHQYNITKYWVERFTQALVTLRENEAKKLKDPDGWQLLQDSYHCRIMRLREEIVEYEILLAHDRDRPVSLSITEIRKISDALIKARIAFKISQKELGLLCGRTEEQIQQYEVKDYQNASFVDFLAVSDALGIEFRYGMLMASLDDYYKRKLDAIRNSPEIEMEQIRNRVSATKSGARG
ncbi:MAG: helix-turn-helix transcriptional regulator [Hormoscilla sp. SP5CHS1]|nr:helix-turn-helix transcriptional regulator [Hormoscilla sp. SP5CHS1]